MKKQKVKEEVLQVVFIQVLKNIICSYSAT